MGDADFAASTATSSDRRKASANSASCRGSIANACDRGAEPLTDREKVFDQSGSSLRLRSHPADTARDRADKSGFSRVVEPAVKVCATYPH